MSTGEKCKNFHTGQTVAYFQYGTFSEYMVLQFVNFNEVYMFYGLSVNSDVTGVKKTCTMKILKYK